MTRRPHPRSEAITRTNRPTRRATHLAALAWMVLGAGSDPALGATVAAPVVLVEEPWHEVQGRVNIAIDRGVDFLLDQQRPDGSWGAHQEKYENGATALALYTLVKSGVRADHPAVVRALAFLRSHHSKYTYEVACHVMALQALGDKSDVPAIKAMAELLERWQSADGGYAYPDGEIDLSNTQYAALGLRAAAAAGARVDDRVWEKMLRRTLKHQQEVKNPYSPAGFGYRVPAQEYTGSMTAAGLGVLAIIKEQVPRLRGELSRPLEQGIAWLAKHFVADQNPTSNGPKPAHRYYYLYAVERVGALLGTETFGDHDWYRAGARFLVDDQQADGCWALWDGKETGTCFALLFLTRATASATGSSVVAGSRSYGNDDPLTDVNLRASGDTPMSVWVSSFGARVDGAFAFDGEEGKGPRVVRVEYAVVGDHAGAAPEVVAIVAGDPARPSGITRYPSQLILPGNGRFWISAEVTVVDPLSESVEAPEYVTLISPRLEVRVRESSDVRLLRYASDATRNLLATTTIESSASSELDDKHPAKRIHDNLLSQGWCSADTDPKPTVTLTLDPPVRADTLLLTPFASGDKDRPARARKVRVVLNGRRDFEVAMNADPTIKTEFSFGKALTISMIEIAVLEACEPGMLSALWELSGAKKGVGFAEVELQDSRRRGRASKNGSR